MGADEQQVASAPPWRQQPERDNELNEPDDPVIGTDVFGLQDRHECFYGEQGYQAEKHVRAQDDPAVYAQRYDHSQRQGSLRKALAERRWNVHKRSGITQGIED